MKKEKENKPIYTLRLTERQAKLLSYACDRFSRLICGQDDSFQELMEEAWEKRCKEAVGGHGMDKEWDGGWYAMRQDAEAICKQIKKCGNASIKNITVQELVNVGLLESLLLTPVLK